MTDILGAAPAVSSPALPLRRRTSGLLDNFRALAIFMIVAGHAFDSHGCGPTSIAEAPGAGFISAIVNGSTFYFVFISGFLYRHVFYGPHAVRDLHAQEGDRGRRAVSVLGGAWPFCKSWSPAFTSPCTKHGEFLGENVYVDFNDEIFTGQMMTAYWYIPFIFVVFAASPLVDRFIEARRGTQVALWLAALGISLWVHRPYENLSPLHATLYFGHVYLAGILFWQVRKP